MDGAFIRVSTLNHISCLPKPILHNIQSSSSGQNKIMSEITAHTLLLQNCNKTCKSMSISVVVVQIKHR